MEDIPPMRSLEGPRGVCPVNSPPLEPGGFL